MLVELHIRVMLQLSDKVVEELEPTADDVINAVLMSINTNQEWLQCLKDIIHNRSLNQKH